MGASGAGSLPAVVLSDLTYRSIVILVKYRSAENLNEVLGEDGLA
jgi:hypothetical protein